MKIFSTRLGLSLALCLFSAQLIAGGKLIGTVQNEDGGPIAKAEVLLLNIKRATRTNPEGRFEFSDVPAGEHRLQISDDAFGHKIQTVTISQGQTTELTVSFDLAIHEAMTISATPIRKSISDVAQAVGVLNEDDLLQKGQPTLGETLANEPGISSTFFGAGASRPLIRGMGGDRIRILEGGIGTGDVSTVSPDHAVSVDTLSVQRIEILRGPASLRYGSNAVGGVINIIDNRIPEFKPTDNFAGSLDLQWDSVSERKSAAFAINGAVGNWAYHADFSSTDADSYDIPENPEPDSEEPFEGFLENSALETQKANVGTPTSPTAAFRGFSFRFHL